jgi:hypothetical protein
MSVHISVPVFLSVCLLPCFLHWATDNFQSLNAGFVGSVNFHLNAYFLARKSINNFNSYCTSVVNAQLSALTTPRTAVNGPLPAFQHLWTQWQPSTDTFRANFELFNGPNHQKLTDQITKSYFMKGNNCPAMPPINRHWKITKYEARCPDKQRIKSADEKGWKWGREIKGDRLSWDERGKDLVWIEGSVQGWRGSMDKKSGLCTHTGTV